MTQIILMAVKLSLGHRGLSSCLQVAGKHPDGLCGFGKRLHILFSGTKYMSERQQLFKGL